MNDERELGEALFRLETIADLTSDGHFTVMKFTGNWKVSVGPQPWDRADIDRMTTGDTLTEAVDRLRDGIRQRMRTERDERYAAKHNAQVRKTQL